MDYQLRKEINKDEGYMTRLISSAKELGSYLDKRQFTYALLLVILSSSGAIITPYILGKGIDTFIAKGDMNGLSYLVIFLVALYLISNTATYFQQSIMGKTAQVALYKLRSDIFDKLQSLPIAFFTQNKTGDLMSRVNNDTDKLSQFLSESILRFVGGAFTLLGIGIFILILNWKLGLVLLSSTVFLLLLTRFLSPVLERANRRSSTSLGEFTAGVSEQLTNFKAVIVYDRRNFFEDFLSKLNKDTYNKYLFSDFLNQLFTPLYDFAGYIAQTAVLIYGIVLISEGEITIGLLIAFLTFAIRFYDPLRWIASIFGNIQVSLASWGRIRDILSLESNLFVLDGSKMPEGHLSRSSKHLAGDHSVQDLLIFEDVDFSYGENNVLNDISFTLEKGKTYALVGPTGGGKSTIASLMSRLYDPTEGSIFFKGVDIRTVNRGELSSSIGVILQEPYMFSGTVAENMKYGNPLFKDILDSDLEKMLNEKKMSTLLGRFPNGISTIIESGGENISLGQKQLISFVRTVLREPELLILDEATANIDTVTESALQDLIDSLAPHTTKVIIAHRLNTIKKADEILFVGGGEVKRVSDEKEVLELLKGALKS